MWRSALTQLALPARSAMLAARAVSMPVRTPVRVLPVLKAKFDAIQSSQDVVGATRPTTAPPSPTLAGPGQGQVRSFGTRVMRTIPWERVIGKVYKHNRNERKSKAKNHAEILNRMRLTRFGWERRRAGFHGRRKHLRSAKRRRRHRSIAYLHRDDYKMIERTEWFFRLKIQDFPQDNNINLKPARKLLSA
eukprot:CAMPEP_0206436462 /NCGR_PEP_ID=MMETSP0324_2-20121206/10493_1 /ASSEMBLY_ACC=CAM_ASM_000836 /TAXON_ID=2866 /ORGANISM="Crypthecodinium cohnii, Strain Seligo" /LENGTH=190 /DNA_ID=CAMNT_0053903623 /DNA_START=86 /DNA_END=654 /DNA_ORIENTATION=-